MSPKLALASAAVAAMLCTSALAAQSSASTTSKPPTAARPAPAIRVKADSSTRSSRSATQHATWTLSEIKAAQQGLAKAGLYKGRITGAMNADTRRALRAYQKQNRLPVTGRLDEHVLARLKSA